MYKLFYYIIIINYILVIFNKIIINNYNSKILRVLIIFVEKEFISKLVLSLIK